MKSIILLLLSILLSTTTISQSQSQQLCPIPTTGCPFGMYNQNQCKCECIPPYCLDVVTGNCIRIPNQVCNINPWINCIKGTNCPWYKHTSETCTTSNTIPPNVVNIYNTKEICCNFNYPYSDSCAGRSSFSMINAGQPTKHPTISRPEESDYEVIPIKFDVLGLPNGIRVREVKDEMTTVLKRVLLRLSDDNEGSMEELIISNVEEKVMPVSINDNNAASSSLRSATSLTLYYNVYLVRNDEYKFGPIIINEIRNRYNEILDQIQSFADTKYFGGNLKMNWCTVKNGRYDLCVLAPNVFDPSSVDGEDSSASSMKGGSTSRLAGWSIALIVIIVLLVVGCGIYWIGVVCYGIPNCLKYDYYQSKNDDIYFDSRSRATEYTNDDRRQSRRRRRDDEKRETILMLTNGYDDRRSQRPLALTNGGDDRRSQRPLALTNGDDGRRSRPLALTNGDDRGISNSGRSRRNKSSSKPLALTAGPHYQSSRTMNTRGTSSSKKSSVKRIKPARDPSLYIPGQEDKPDPEGSIADEVLMLTQGAAASRSGNSRRYYDDDNTPPPKVKREPTMYIDGEATIEEDDPKPLKSATKKRNDKQQQIVLAESSFSNIDNEEENKRYPDYMASFKTEDYDMPPQEEEDDDEEEEEGYYIDAISQGEPSFLTEDPSYATQSRAQSEYSRKKKKPSRR